MLIQDKIIVALDVSNIEQAQSLVEQLSPYVGAFKIGMQLFYNEGPRIVAMIAEMGGKVFLDLKMHDIPNTVARACEGVTVPGVFMFNVHVSGGVEMMREAAKATRERAKDLGIAKPLLIGVTVLTSFDNASLAQVGIPREASEQAVHLATLAQQAGLDGVVASAQEAAEIRKACGAKFIIVTPGIRPAGEKIQDQKRVATPGQAVKEGADYLVIGRPITSAQNPVEVVKGICKEMEEGMKA